MSKNQYASTSYERGISGKVESWSVCDACGADTKNQYGFKFDFQIRGRNGGGRMALCAKCSRKLMPKLLEAVENIHTTAAVMRHINKDKNYSERTKDMITAFNFFEEASKCTE